MTTSPLISPEQLKQQLTDASLVVLDARSGKDAYEMYARQHLMHAWHIDLDRDLAAKTKDASHGGRHPLPDHQAFCSLLGKLGISPASHVVVYDDKYGANAAARTWWMLRACGHEQVQVLDGGWQAAIKAGLPLSDAIPHAEPLAPYPSAGWSMPMATMDEVATAMDDQHALIIDVRETYRYRGEREPIDLVAGHIPHAINAPYQENLADDGSFRSAQELASDYRRLLGDRTPAQVIVHCGSGVTACHTLLALESAGMPGAKLYVGSWSEWSRNDRPMVTGS